MIITGVVLAALLNTANAQFAIENNSKLGAKVENVSETTKRFLLDFGSDANAGESIQVKGLVCKSLYGNRRVCLCRFEQGKMREFEWLRQSIDSE